MNFSDKKQVRQFIEENDIRDIGALNKMLKNVSGVFIEQILEAEQEEHLGYDRYQRTEKPKTNASITDRTISVCHIRHKHPFQYCTCPR